jgi:mono/diheme cytochrome c family protein
MTPRRRPALFAALLVAAAPPLAAQSGEGTQTGGYTEHQASRGAEVFRRYCAQCHVAGQFATAAFRRAWTGLTAYELFEQIRTTMPNDNPGRLPRRDYADLVAYVFKLNGVVAGAAELAPAPDSLRRVRFTPPPEPDRR